MTEDTPANKASVGRRPGQVVLAITLLAGLLWVPTAHAASPEAAESTQVDSTQVDSTDLYETKHYPLLELPQTIWNGLVYPLAQTTIYAEHEKLPQKAREWFTNEKQTFGLFPQVRFGGETSTSGGGQLFLFTRSHVLNAVYTIRDTDRHAGSLQYTDHTGEATYWNFAADFLKTNDEGATVNGSVEDRLGALFAIERADIMGTVGWRSNGGPLHQYNKGFMAAARFGWGRRDFASQQPLTPLAEGFGLTPAASQLGGLNEAISLFTLGATFQYDDRDFATPVQSLSHPLNYQFPGRMLLRHEDAYHSYRDTFYPENGNLLMAEFDYITGSDEARFVRLAAEAQRFQTLFWRNRILAGRVRLDKVHGIDNGLVPFPDLPSLGGSQRLRGYERGGLRGEGALLLAVEYRWPVWDTWNAFLFHEEGQVFDEYGDVDPDQFVSSTGGGLSLRSPTGLLLGLRLAHSAEEHLLTGFSLEQEF